MNCKYTYHDYKTIKNICVYCKNKYIYICFPQTTTTTSSNKESTLLPNIQKHQATPAVESHPSSFVAFPVVVLGDEDTSQSHSQLVVV